MLAVDSIVVEEGRNLVRFILIVFVLVVAALAGLYIYSGMIEPETRMIEQEATGAATQ